MSAQLTPITELSDLKALQELYLKDWPNHCVGFYWLDNFLRWLAKGEAKHLIIYSLNGDWRQDGLFLLVHRYQLFFANLSRQPTLELRLALRLLDWSDGFKVSSIYETHQQVFKELLAERQLSFEQENKTAMFHMPCAKAKELQIICPKGYQLQPLGQEHAALINEHWSARHHGSLKLIQLLIAHNVSIGLIDKATQQLCGWCLRLQSGFLGALQVAETHQRRGLGALLVSAMAQRIASELEHDVIALVYMNNIAAYKLFQQLGFALRSNEHYFWTMSLPTARGVKWNSEE